MPDAAGDYARRAAESQNRRTTTHLRVSQSDPVIRRNTKSPSSSPFSIGTRVSVRSGGGWSPAKVVDFDEAKQFYTLVLTLTQRQLRRVPPEHVRSAEHSPKSRGIVLLPELPAQKQKLPGWKVESLQVRVRVPGHFVQLADRKALPGASHVHSSPKRGRRKSCPSPS